jgi:hypothetical protein
MHVADFLTVGVCFGVQCGSPLWMAPEMIKNDPYDEVHLLATSGPSPFRSCVLVLALPVAES